jgi:hypothetical protein
MLVVVGSDGALVCLTWWVPERRLRPFLSVISVGFEDLVRRSLTRTAVAVGNGGDQVVLMDLDSVD